jgi:Kef-type K+ transport system membrane component KefB
MRAEECSVHSEQVMTLDSGSLRAVAQSLPLLAKFAIGLVVIVIVPPLSRKARLPAVVGLLLAGVLLGPHALDVVGTQRPVADFFGEIGKLMLMFMAGMEIDLETFRRVRNRALIFGIVTTSLPLLLGTAAGLAFGYDALAAVVIGSLLASHTLLGSSIVAKLGLTKLEPISVTYGATMFSDTSSLVVFAICASTFQRGFSIGSLATLLVEIAIFIPFVLVGLSRAGALLLRKVEGDESAYFAVMLAILAVAATLAQVIQLPGIVGAFLSGLALNAAVREKAAKRELEFIGNSLFIPIFFITTGFLIDPRALLHSIANDAGLVAAIIGALVVGKYVAAELTGRAFGYSPDARRTVWSLTLPQVAATLAAALVAYDTFDPSRRRLLDTRMLNVVLVLMLATSILGPVLTERFAPRLSRERATRAPDSDRLDAAA